MRAIDADALLYNLEGTMAVSPTGYIHGDTIVDMIGDAPTIEPDILPDGTLMIDVLDLDKVHRVLVSSGKRCKIFYLDEE